MTNLPELRRDRSDAKVAGVCAALARSWNVDPLLVRLGFVVLALVTNGFAVMAYVALAVLIPERGDRSEPVRDLLPFTRSWTSQQLFGAVVAGSVVLGLLVSGAGAGALVVALLVLAIVRWGVRGQPARTAPPQPAGPRTEFERLASVWQQRVDNVAVGLPPDWSPEPAWGSDDPHGLYAPAAAPTVSHPARRRRGVRTWSAVAVTLGVVWSGLAVLQATGVSVPALAWCAATLAVLALALVLVARPSRATHGRPPGLLPAGVIAALATLLVMIGAPGVVADGPRYAVAPSVLYSTTTLPELVEGGLGSRTVDLSAVALDADRTVRVTTEIGRLRVVIPAEGNVVVRYRVEMGSARIDGSDEGGMDIESTWHRITDPNLPTLTLDAVVEVGLLEVIEP